MPQRRKSIYVKVYTGISIVFILFFFHHVFTPIHYDVLHINKEFRFTLFGVQYTHCIRDAFPAFNAQSPQHQMDVQIYFSRLGNKMIHFVSWLLLVQSLKLNNMFFREMPGRKSNKLIAISWVMVALFAYEVLDFIVHAGQTNWLIQASVFFAVLSVVALTVKD